MKDLLCSENALLSPQLILPIFSTRASCQEDDGKSPMDESVINMEND